MWTDFRNQKGELASDGREAASSSLEELVKAEMINSTLPQVSKPTSQGEQQRQSATETKGSSRASSNGNAPTARETCKQMSLAEARQETLAKETQVRNAIQEKQERLQQEVKRLAVIDGELRKLSAKEQADIGILRAELEEVDRKLVWLDQDMKRKEVAYSKAKQAFETLDARKRSMHEHLALIVLSSEKRKEAKLNELLARMKAHPTSS